MYFRGKHCYPIRFEEDVMSGATLEPFQRRSLVPCVSSALCALLLLVACGGGGSGGGGSRIPDPTLPKVCSDGSEVPADQVCPPPPLTTSDPEFHLATERFTTHQPNVLEQIGAHHAYAKGLTGKGVRIGIDDTIVDYTQSAEFGSRIKLTDAEGATLYYDRFDGNELFGDVHNCLSDPECQAWRVNSGGDAEELNRVVRQVVRDAGMPRRDDSVFVFDEYHRSTDNLFASLLEWKEVPTPYEDGTHGTSVASIAAGKSLGVAPEATIIPIAKNLTGDQRAEGRVEDLFRGVVEALPSGLRGVLDDQLADFYQDYYAKFDIINRSFGRRASFGAILNEHSAVQWHLDYLPNTLDAWSQVGTPSAEETIIVYAAGNSQDGRPPDPRPGLGAALPYFFSPLRGHTLAVVATNPATGVIADYSYRCGPLPSNWNVTRHGPHYCLAAPGTVRGLVPNPATPGQGDVEDGISGTSFAAPMVSGALALMMEHFRGTRGNTAVVKRMLDTANRNGRYGDLETYGAGFLDLGAALSPVGTLNAGQSALSLERTTLYTPIAFGAVAKRTADIELAVFDGQDFPFWIPVSSRIVTQADPLAIPVFDEGVEVVAGLDSLEQRWMSLGGAEHPWSPGGEWVFGFSPTSASLGYQPRGRGWGYGLSFDDDGYLGSHGSGAFGSDLRSGFSWVTRSFQRDLGTRWSVRATGTLAFGAPSYEKNAMFEATPSLFSAMSVRVGSESMGLTVQQPLRAETGNGTFRVENGRIENGRRLYDERRIPLRPVARELRMTLRHEREAAGGRIAMEAGVTLNAGHTIGEYESHVGLAFRSVW